MKIVSIIDHRSPLDLSDLNDFSDGYSGLSISIVELLGNENSPLLMMTNPSFLVESHFPHGIAEFHTSDELSDSADDVGESPRTRDQSQLPNFSLPRAGEFRVDGLLLVSPNDQLSHFHQHFDSNESYHEDISGDESNETFSSIQNSINDLCFDSISFDLNESTHFSGNDPFSICSFGLSFNEFAHHPHNFDHQYDEHAQHLGNAPRHSSSHISTNSVISYSTSPIHLDCPALRHDSRNDEPFETLRSGRSWCESGHTARESSPDAVHVLQT
jgi:hypothetical protein